MIIQKLIEIQLKEFQTINTVKRCMFVDVVKKGRKIYAVAILDDNDIEEKKIEICIYKENDVVNYAVESLFYISSFSIGVFKKQVYSVYNKRRFADEKRPYRPYAEAKKESNAKEINN